MRFIVGLTVLACASGLVGCGANANGRANNGPVVLTHTQHVASPSLSTEPAALNLNETLSALQHSVARIEQRMDSLESHFTTLKLEPQSKPRVSSKAAPVIKAEKKPVVETKSLSKVTGKGVYAVRIGTHADKVRLVFDMAQKAKTNVVLDEAENLLSVDIDGAVWNAAQQNSYKAGQAVLESYQVTPRENGATVVFALRGATKILQQSTLKNPTRLVIDLAR